jgi:hypothetical protein
LGDRLSRGGLKRLIRLIIVIKWFFAPLLRFVVLFIGSRQRGLL